MKQSYSYMENLGLDFDPDSLFGSLVTNDRFTLSVERHFKLGLDSVIEKLVCSFRNRLDQLYQKKLFNGIVKNLMFISTQ